MQLTKHTVLGVLLLAILFSCNNQEITGSTTSDLNITPYLRKHPEQFSEFVKILDNTGTAGFLGAYGTYTFFAPTNEAVLRYLERVDATSVEELDVVSLKKLVRFHVLQDTVSTVQFTDGRINIPTMYGQYLITGATNVEGISYIQVNRQAKITQSNIRCGNGLIQVIDDVLIPAELTLATLLTNNPSYSIFTRALQETGLIELLNIPAVDTKTPVWYTVLAQKDAVFNKEGIMTFEDLKAKYSITPDLKDPSNGLRLFMSYRILPGIKYLVDLIASTSHPTLAPLEVITTRLSQDSVLVNDDIINGIKEKGSFINRGVSDVSATNGALHSVENNFSIKVRKPFPVYWDVCEQPEFRKMTSDFRRPGKSFEVTDIFQDIDWADLSTNTTLVHFKYATTATGSTDPFYFGDYLQINFRPDIIQYAEFTTPLLVRGKYKIWICYRRQNYNDLQAFFDNEPLPRIFGLNPSPSYPTGTEAETETLGWKLYSLTATGTTNSSWLGRLLGTVDVKTTDRHKFKITSLTSRGGSTGSPFWLDMIHFIPVDQNQIRPRFKVDGTIVP